MNIPFCDTILLPCVRWISLTLTDLRIFLHAGLWLLFLIQALSRLTLLLAFSLTQTGISPRQSFPFSLSHKSSLDFSQLLQHACPAQSILRQVRKPQKPRKLSLIFCSPTVVHNYTRLQQHRRIYTINTCITQSLLNQNLLIMHFSMLPLKKDKGTVHVENITQGNPEVSPP